MLKFDFKTFANEFINKDEYEKLYSRKEEIPGNRLEICADDFSYQTDEKLLKKIDDFISVK